MDQVFVDIIKSLLSKKKKITIITHVNPDGDAIGSSLAWYHILKLEGHEVSVVVPNYFPSFLAWLPEASEIIVHKKDKEKAEERVLNADLIFCLDFNDIGRMAKVSDCYTKSNATKILIDHHLQPSLFTDYTLSVSNTSSTAELIYELISEIELTHLITKDVAQALYVGIITDTGSLSYACNYKSTYNAIAFLMEVGIDGEHIHRLVYDTNTYDRIRLLGYCLSEKLKVFPEYKLAYISLTKEELKKFNYNVGDTEGIVNYTLSIEGVSVGVFFMEREGIIKVSLRSKGELSVNDMARKYFNGAGHHNAAGGELCGSLNDHLSRFEEMIPEMVKI